jgi:HEXXH motif-containing protein
MVGEYGRALLQIALERCDALVASHAVSLGHRLPRILARPLPWPAVWNPALANLERLLVRPTQCEVVWDGIVQLMINLAAAGTIAEADIRLHEPQALWWGGLRLPIVDRLAFRQRHDGVVLELSRGMNRPVQHLLRRSVKCVWTARTLPAVPVLWMGEHPLLVRRATRDTSYPLPKGQCVLARVPAGTAATFAEAARLLRRVNHQLLPWVCDAVRIIVPLKINDDVRMSATIEEFPGLTFLSLPLEPADVATRLVHEASHHYFFALQRLKDLHDGSDVRNYYSPIKERSRMIDMILFAFHAFGNGALFHRDLARWDGRFERIAGNTVEQAIAPLRILHGYLARTPALTTEGKTLWKPVAERLFG